MKQKLLLVLCVISLVALSSGCLVREATFSLESWKVIGDGGRPSIVIACRASDSVRLCLTDPNGVEVDSEYVEKGITGANLCLAPQWHTPVSGTYTLIAKDRARDTIFTDWITFLGVNLLVSKIIPHWKYHEWSDEYCLEGLRVFMKNEGDLPAYPSCADVEINGNLGTFSFLTTVMPPNSEREISGSIHMSGISSEEQYMTITLKDIAGYTIVEYPIKVTPAN
mgnify:CR=1 FL=1